MDRFDAIAAFIAVCDAGGFAAASRRLRVSPSVVTRQVASLEQHLGARLLQRTTRSIGADRGGTALSRTRPHDHVRPRRGGTRRAGRARGADRHPGGGGAAPVRAHARRTDAGTLHAEISAGQGGTAIVGSCGELDRGRDRRRHPDRPSAGFAADRPAARRDPPRGRREPLLTCASTAGRSIPTSWRGTTPLRSWGSLRPPTGASPTTARS